MSLIEKIKVDQLSARVAHDSIKSSILTTLIGEGVAIGKNDGKRETTDGEMIALVKKFIKNNDEVLLVIVSASDLAITTVKEQNVLKSYLPKQLTIAELRDIIGVCVLGGQSMGGIMTTLKTHHNGLYDGKIASTMIKEILGV